jgi:hypothetical protein
VLDVHNQAAMTPDQVRSTMYEWTERLGIQEWRCEDNAFQKWLTLDREINTWMAKRGVVLQPHTTGANKADPELGVASMAPLFRGWGDGWNAIRLPSTNKSYGVKALVDQLVTWFPGTKAKQDTVMALWFAELRARELVSQTSSADFMDSKWLSERQRNSWQIVDLYEGSSV